MVRLNINRKRSGVPVLSRKQIDDIGERLVQDFCPDAMVHPQALDVDLFAQDYLGMEQDYQYLSHCGVYLGMTVFNDTNKVVVYNPEKQEAEYISARAKTIIIDNTLLEENQEHRYRFTMGHEAAGHGVLHEEYFGYDRNQLTLFDTANEAAMIQCRTDSSKIASKDSRLWDDHDWMEWQANTFASCLLMPRRLVMEVTSLVCELEFECKEGAKQTDQERKEEAVFLTALQDKLFADHQLASELLVTIKDVFRVSESAAFYRLRSLNLLPEESQLLPSGIVVY